MIQRLIAVGVAIMISAMPTKIPDEQLEEWLIKPMEPAFERGCKQDFISVYHLRDIREEMYHILEDTTEEDFYSAFFKKNFGDELGGVYQDRSSSMKEIFKDEKSIILNNLSPMLREREQGIEEQKPTNLYEFLCSLDEEPTVEEKFITIHPKEVPIIITDLWDIADKQPFRYEGEIIFCVPYTSTNKEGVLHCEEVVNDLLWNHSWPGGGKSIYVVYTDEVIVRYCNAMEGFIEIYVP